MVPGLDDRLSRVATKKGRFRPWLRQTAKPAARERWETKNRLVFGGRWEVVQGTKSRSTVTVRASDIGSRQPIIPTAARNLKGQVQTALEILRSARDQYPRTRVLRTADTSSSSTPSPRSAPGGSSDRSIASPPSPCHPPSPARYRSEHRSSCRSGQWCPSRSAAGRCASRSR